MVNTVETEIHPTQRRSMLRELIYHQEAIAKAAYQYPPIGTTDHSASWSEMLTDPTVHYAVSLITESILAQGYDIEPAEKGRGQLALADTIKRNLADIDIEGALDDALNALWRGFWCHEITWTYANGKHQLASLAAVDPDQIAIELNDQMKVTAILSRPTAGPQMSKPQRLPADKIWMHINRPGRTRPAGESILENAFRAWSSKNRLLQFWGLSLQRFGMTNIKVTIPSNTPPAEQTNILNTLYQGRLDGVYLCKDSYLVEPWNPTQWANLTFEHSIAYQDAEIVKAIVLFASPSAQGTGGVHVTGTSIQAEQRATAFRMQRISRALADSFTRQVIHPLCTSNWGAHPEQCPRMVLAPPDSTRIVELAQPLMQLVTAGIVDVETAADQMGLPEPTNAAQPRQTENSANPAGPGARKPATSP